MARRQSGGAAHAVFVFDGFITLESGRTDALFVEAVCYGVQRTGFKMVVPYRNSLTEQGFAVYRPKFLATEGERPLFDAWGEAFFRGVDSHEKGAEAWNAKIDQSN